MSGIRPPDSSRDGARQTEPQRERPVEREPARQVAEDATRLAQLLRRGSRANEASEGPPGRDRGSRETGDGRVGQGPDDDGRLRVGERGPRGGQSAGHGADQEGEREGEQPLATPPAFRGEDILAGFGGTRVAVPSKEEIRNRELSELVSGIVSRLLVGERDGTPELRVTLAGELLGQPS